MRNFFYRASFLALALTFASTGDSAEQIEIVGLGASPCSQYLEEISGNIAIEREYLSWALGYMSGLLVRAPPGEIVQLRNSELPLTKQAGYLRTYCTGHPNEAVSDAVQELYKILRAASPKPL